MKVLERITIWATHLKHTVSKIIIQKSFNRHPQNFKSDKYVQHVHLRIIQITIQTSNFDRTSNHSFCAVFEFYSFSATLPPRYLFDLRWKLSLPEDQALWASAPIEYIRCYKLHILIDIDRICIHDVLAVYIYIHTYIYIHVTIICEHDIFEFYSIWQGWNLDTKESFELRPALAVPGGERQDRPLPEIWKHRWHRRWSSAQDFSAGGNPGGMDMESGFIAGSLKGSLNEYQNEVSPITLR